MTRFRKKSMSELNRLAVDDFQKMEKIPLVVILDNIRSAQNVGSIFRSADAFALEEIILHGITAKPPHKEINKTAIGATDSVLWSYIENASEVILELKRRELEILSLEQTHDSIHPAQYVRKTAKKGIAIIVGNEVKGVSQSFLEVSDEVLEIPQYGTKHSLNVAVSTGIVLYHLSTLLRA